MKLVITLILFISILQLGIQNVFACDCIPITVEDGINTSDVIFSGKVKSIKYLDNPKKTVESRIIVTFDVFQFWKGKVDREITLYTTYNRHSCQGYAFNNNGEYLVYANKQIDGNLGTNICKRTTLLSYAKDDLSVLSQGIIPTEGFESRKRNTFDFLPKLLPYLIVTVLVIGIMYKIFSAKIKQKYKK